MTSPFSPKDFVGVRVKISLKQPDARVFEGTITDVQSTEGVPSLALKEVILQNTNTRFPSWIISGAQIQDVELVNPKPERDLVSHQTSAKQDPAIVTFSRPRKQPSNVASEYHLAGSEKHAPSVSDTSQLGDTKSLNNTSKEPVEIEGVAISPVPQSSKSANPSISHLLNRIGDVKDKQQLQILHKEISVLLDNQDDMKDQTKTNGKASSRSKGKASYKGKGWRETPILQETNPEESVKSTGNSKQKQRRKRKVFKEDPTGWATEDATDIQTMGAFDFEGSLAKFDKKKVFDQLRKEDQVAHEDRLVGHNRVARPGTFGGTKLHPTEMVLDGQPRTGSATGRRGSHRSPVIIAASSDTDPAASGISQKVTAAINPKLSRTNTSTSVRANSRKKATAAASIASQDTMLNITPASSSPKPITFNSLNKAEDVYLFYQDHVTACPALAPGGMAALEKISKTLYNLTSEVSNENAGRTLAESIISELRLPKNARLASQEKLTAMIFVGNHHSGARALVAARHLRARGIICVCCVLGLDRPGHSVDAEVEKQLNMIRTPDAVIANWREVQKYLLHKEESGQHAEIWVDAMLATGHGYDTLVPDDQSAVREIVAWINRRHSSLGQRLVFSIDVPCGISDSTGEALVIDDNHPLQLRSSNIVCMGAPRIGLLNAIRAAWAFSTTADEIAGPSVPHAAILSAKLSVVDVGVNDAWLTYGESLGLSRGPIVDFGPQWYIRLHVAHMPGYSDDDDNGEDTDVNDDDDD